MAVKFNFRGTVNTLAGHKRNLANTKKRDDAARKIQGAYRAALERRRKKESKEVKEVKTKKPKKKKLVKSKVRALLKLNRPALEQKLLDTRELTKKFNCVWIWDKNLRNIKHRLTPTRLKTFTNRELVDIIRRLEQSCFTSVTSRIPTKQERKYFAGVNMSNDPKMNKNYVPSNNNENGNLRALGWKSERYMNGYGIEPINQQALNNFKKGNMTTGRIPKLPNEYIYTNDSEINNAKNNLHHNEILPYNLPYKRHAVVKPAMNNSKLRAYMRNQIMNRFGVDPNKNERFIRLDNWMNYSFDPNKVKVYQYANTLRQPGKLAGKKSNPMHKNWLGFAVPTTGVGRRKVAAELSGLIQRQLAQNILEDLNRASYGNNINWVKNLSENDKRYMKRLLNTHYNNNKFMTNAVANNIIKRFGKRFSRAARKKANKTRANDFKSFIERDRYKKNEFLKGMGMQNEFLKKMGI